MGNSFIIIKRIKQEENNKNLEMLLTGYIRCDYSIEALLESTKDFCDEKRHLVLETIVDFKACSLVDVADCKYITNDDKVYVIKKLINDGIHISSLAYCIMYYINDPKKYLNDEEIKRVLDDVDIDEIIKEYGAYFADELLKRDDCYKLLKVKEKLPDDVIKKIYEKSFDSGTKFSNVISFLDEKEKKEYAKLFLDSKSHNFGIAIMLFYEEFYYEEDRKRLLQVIADVAPGSVIYKILMDEKLTKEEIDMLEKGLLKTHDIEYIAYYYFFKNKERFILLFGSTLLFLSFVTLNEDMFTDKKILNSIIETIKSEEKHFSEEICSKVNNSFIKKMRTTKNND